jgi:fatty-acyl-CoA synthase
MTLPGLLNQLALTFGDRIAVTDEAESVTYLELVARCGQFRSWAIEQGLGKGDVIALLMPNCINLLAIWLGVSQMGCAVALLNIGLVGEMLLHALAAASPTHLIVHGDLTPVACDIERDLSAEIWVCNDTRCGDIDACPKILDREAYATNPQMPAGHVDSTGPETALLLYTSGTTGLPKAARITHYRLLEWSFWFAGMLNTTSEDRLYNCLPMYHSTGGVVGIGAILVNGGTIILRRRFSARQFWPDIVAERCTLFLYIGELCRYLINAPMHPLEHRHRIRMSFGNGLSGSVWQRFAERFAIPRVLEFYASTEGNVSLYNCEGKIGAIGRVPPFLAERFPVALVVSDPVTGEPQRGADGLCLPCINGVVGEAVGRIGNKTHHETSSFDGYTDRIATESKIIRTVLRPGDKWFRTGDLMRRDHAGFFYFVDRLGDTFRWKGENMSTAQVASTIGECRNVAAAVVYGVEVPGCEGRAGMAAIMVVAGFEIGEFNDDISSALPTFARPVFIRIAAAFDLTATYKPIKNQLLREGYDPRQVMDDIFVKLPGAYAYKKLDADTHAQISSGSLSF